jgi:hypothetical protein
MSMCRDCPCQKYVSEWTQQGQDYGCLPTRREILKEYDEHHRIWACHANEKRVCGGLVEHRGVDKNAQPTYGTTFWEHSH